MTANKYSKNGLKVNVTITLNISTIAAVLLSDEECKSAIARLSTLGLVLFWATHRCVLKKDNLRLYFYYMTEHLSVLVSQRYQKMHYMYQALCWCVGQQYMLVLLTDTKHIPSGTYEEERIRSKHCLFNALNTVA